MRPCKEIFEIFGFSIFLWCKDAKPEILAEIHKFPYPIQRLIAEKMRVVSKRLENGEMYPVSPLLNVTVDSSITIYYLVVTSFMSNVNILSPNIWRKFRQLFEENEFAPESWGCTSTSTNERIFKFNFTDINTAFSQCLFAHLVNSFTIPTFGFGSKARASFQCEW